LSNLPIVTNLVYHKAYFLANLFKNWRSFDRKWKKM